MRTAQQALREPEPIVASSTFRPLREGLAEILLAGGRKRSSEDSQDLGGNAPAIVFAPHPDDEVLGCGGTIALKAKAGADVHVVVMTDGRTSHARFMDAPSLVHMRQLEAIEAGRQLGLEPSAYTFLGIEDQCLNQHFDQAEQRVLEVLRRFRPRQVFVPHRHDRLADHVSTFRIVASALGRQEDARHVTVLEYPVWLWNTWPWSGGLRREDPRLVRVQRMLRDGFELAFGCRSHVDIRPVLKEKADALDAYRSQMQRLNDIPDWPVLSDVSNGAFLARFLSGREVFRRTEY